MTILQESTLTFVAGLASFGDRPALVADGSVVTYADLAGRIGEAGLRLGGVRRLVLIAGANDLDSVVAYLGALAAGHPVLLTPDRDDVVASTVAAYDPDAVVRAGAVHERRAGTVHELHPSLALLMSTSGSTGSPRLVRLSADNLQANAESIATALRIRETDVAVTTLPLYYCYGLSVLHSHLLRGATVLLTSLSVVDPCFWAEVRRHRATSLAGVPYTYDLLDRVGFDGSQLSSLRCLTQAGGRLAPERVRRWAELGQRHGFDFFVMYGQTEATARMAYLPPDLAQDHPAAIGVPVPGGSLRIDTLTDGPGEPGVGELVYAGPNVMLGYAESPADLALGRATTELRTGDLARRGPDGLVEIVGRVARFAKVYGLRVDLERVERLLAERGHRVSCAAGEDRLVVAAERCGGPARRGPAEQVAAAVCEVTALPPSAVRVSVVEMLPRLATGKPDLVAVAALDRTSAAVGGPNEPTDVAGTFRLVLGRSRIRPEDSFVALGGDSLSYVEMSVRLEQILGQLPTRWHERTVAELASIDRRHGRRMRAVETNVVLRALASVAIVGTHSNLFVLTGGAHLLLALVGFNLARFQLVGEARIERCRRLLRAAARVAVPSVLWIGAVALLTGAYSWPTVLLVNGLFGPSRWSEPAWYYWFIEALVFSLLAVAALIAVPALDRAERRWPFWFPVVLSLLALVTRYEVVLLRDGDQIHRASVIFWLVALGWAVARATSHWHRLVVSALAVLSVPGFFGDGAREAVVVLGLLALVWLPAIRLPLLLVRGCGVLAASSLWVYLTQWQVYPHLEDRYPLAALLASLAVGIVVWQVAGWLGRAMTRAGEHLTAYGSLTLRRSQAAWSAPHRRRAAPVGPRAPR